MQLLACDSEGYCCWERGHPARPNASWERGHPARPNACWERGHPARPNASVPLALPGFPRKHEHGRDSAVLFFLVQCLAMREKKQNKNRTPHTETVQGKVLTVLKMSQSPSKSDYI